MDVFYVGPHEVVELPLPLGGYRIVERLAAVSVADDHGRSLLEQPANWSRRAPKGREARRAAAGRRRR